MEWAEGLAMNAEEVVSTTVRLTVANGLHLSPISQIVGRANGFSSSISLSFDGKTADAKSVYDLMLLAAPCGAILTLDATGADAQSAVNSLSELFNGGFVIPD